LPDRLLPLAFLLVALLPGLARDALLLLTGLRLPALLLLPRCRLTTALLLTGLLVGSLRLLRSMVRIIHLSTSLVKIEHNRCNAYCAHYKVIKKISARRGIHVEEIQR